MYGVAITPIFTYRVANSQSWCIGDNMRVLTHCKGQRNNDEQVAKREVSCTNVPASGAATIPGGDNRGRSKVYAVPTPRKRERYGNSKRDTTTSARGGMQILDTRSRPTSMRWTTRPLTYVDVTAYESILTDVYRTAVVYEQVEEGLTVDSERTAVCKY